MLKYSPIDILSAPANAAAIPVTKISCVANPAPNTPATIAKTDTNASLKPKIKSRTYCVPDLCSSFSVGCFGSPGVGF